MLVDFDTLKQVAESEHTPRGSTMTERSEHVNAWWEKRGIDPEAVQRWAMAEVDEDFELHFTPGTIGAFIGSIDPEVAVKAIIGTAYTIGLRTGILLAERMEK